MTEQITLKEALKLVSFQHIPGYGWRVRAVHGYVWGTINGLKWKYVETPKEKLQRLLDKASEAELLKLINQLEDNS